MQHPIWHFYMGKKDVVSDYKNQLLCMDDILENKNKSYLMPFISSQEDWRQVLEPDLQLLFQVLNVPHRNIIFLTGIAGSGKSHLIERFMARVPHIKVELTAPMAVSARNIGGETIYRALGLGLASETVEEIWQHIDTPQARKRKIKTWNFLLHTQVLIVDEISTLNPGLFDKLHLLFQKARNNTLPFGGVKLLLTGDFCQLSPVIKNKNAIHQHHHQNHQNHPSQSESEAAKLFYAQVWNQLPIIKLVLVRNYRQGEGPFLNLCNHARVNQLTDEEWSLLESRVITKQDAQEKCSLDAILKKYIQQHQQDQDSKDPFHPSDIREIVPVYICCTNAVVDSINETQMKVLQQYGSVPIRMYPKFSVAPHGTKKRVDDDDFAAAQKYIHDLKDPKNYTQYKSEFPVFDITLSVGCQVMLRCNTYFDSHGLYNGSMGIVLALATNNRDSKIAAGEGFIRVAFRSHRPDPATNLYKWIEVNVTTHEFRSRINKTADLILLQYPLTTCYSMTIHKMQGLTVSDGIIDMSNIFTHGQAYVAISRFQTLEGMQIVGLKRNVFLIDQENIDFEKIPDDIITYFQIKNQEFDVSISSSIMIPKHQGNVEQQQEQEAEEAEEESSSVFDMFSFS